MNQDYNYESAGFDGFLSRSIDSTPQVNLNSQGPVSSSIRYDAAGVSGMLGDTLQLGRVHLNSTNITVSDENNVRVLIGEDNGF